jgi:AbrB family looped-hinge helix DNA binding protein
MTNATIGERYQVVIPRKEREKLHLRPHSKVRVEARDDCIIIYPMPSGGWRGIGRMAADGEDATDYVARLRAEWSERE